MSHTAALDPEHLLARAWGGDGAALGNLLQSYRNWLTVLARFQIGRRLQSKADGEDLVGDTFMEACRHFAVFRGTTLGEFRSWLHQILAGVIAKFLRRYYGTQCHDVGLEQQLADEIEASSQALGRNLLAPQSTPSQHAARHEQAVRLADALQCLPEHYRDVIMLSALEALSWPEVARRIDRSVDSVKHLWTRALEKLQVALGGEP